MEGAAVGVIVGVEIQARMEFKHKTLVLSSVHLNRIISIALPSARFLT